MKKQKLPEWFNGELYKDGAEVTNPFSKEKYKLNNIELSMYDFIMGATIAMEMGIINNKITKEHIRGLDWFKQNNIEAYMVLLD